MVYSPKKAQHQQSSERLLAFVAPYHRGLTPFFRKSIKELVKKPAVANFIDASTRLVFAHATGHNLLTRYRKAVARARRQNL